MLDRQPLTDPRLRQDGYHRPVDEDLPLGQYPQFRGLTGREFRWGPSEAWRAWFAGGVVDGLVDVIDEHIAAIQNGYQRGLVGPAAVGCVPWLTSGPILDRLAALAGCCIVISKAASRKAASALAAADNALPNVSSGLRDLAPMEDGQPVVVGPGSSMPEHDLGPLRISGWGKGKGRAAPLMHAKLLVLGELRWAEDVIGGGEDLFFFSRSVWWGSANWTKGSTNNLEIGLWSDDKTLVDQSKRFVESVIEFSEPWDSTAESPDSNLRSIEFDDEAFAEYMAEYGGFPHDEDDEDADGFS